VIHSKKWVRFFIEQGHDVHVLTPNPPPPVPIEGATLYSLKRQLGKKSLPKLCNYLSLVKQSYTYIRSIKPDILNVLFLTDYGFWGALSGFHPFVITPWGSDVLRHPFQKRFWYYINFYALKKCDLIISNSKPMHAVLVNKMKVPEDKISDIILTGVDFGEFYSEKHTGLKQKLGIEEEIIIFSNRNLESIYNIDCIIHMFALFRKTKPNSQLIIAGDGSQRDVLKDLSNRLNLGSSIAFEGKISANAIRDYLNLSDLFVTVPQSDSCATSLMEAFACKSTLVASDIDGNKAWINNGVNGWLINPKDYKRFSQICLKALNEPIADENIEANFRRVQNVADQHVNMHKIEMEYYKLANSNY